MVQLPAENSKHILAFNKEYPDKPNTAEQIDYLHVELSETGPAAHDDDEHELLCDSDNEDNDGDNDDLNGFSSEESDDNIQIDDVE